MRCTLVYTADEKFKVLTGKQTDALLKPLEGKFKPSLIAVKTLETRTDKRIFAFTNYGNCHKIDISNPKLDCKLSDNGLSLKELSKDAETGEKVVAMFAVEEKLPYGSLLFFTEKGMIKKSDWAEYEQRKDSFQAVKLNEEDELLSVEEDIGDEDTTVIMVTKDGICLNALKDDIPTQGRISTGVRGIMLREGDKVVLMQQIKEEGEVVIATTEGRFKRVIAAQIEPSKRYRKGSVIVGLKDGASVLAACFVTEPYALAVVDDTNTVTELSTERTPISVQSSRAQKVTGYKEGSVKQILPMPYKTEN
jgi:DNA gyrase subunit A